jgi:hypothetical protein
LLTEKTNRRFILAGQPIVNRRLGYMHHACPSFLAGVPWNWMAHWSPRTTQIDDPIQEGNLLQVNRLNSEIFPVFLFQKEKRDFQRRKSSRHAAHANLGPPFFSAYLEAQVQRWRRCRFTLGLGFEPWRPYAFLCLDSPRRSAISSLASFPPEINHRWRNY